jgi:tetratricopeptide (TPR) repeat protein
MNKRRRNDDEIFIPHGDQEGMGNKCEKEGSQTDIKKFFDDHRVAVIRFILACGFCFSVFLTIHTATGEVPLLFLTAVPFLAAIVIMLIVNKSGGFFVGWFYRARRSGMSVDERLRFELNKIRFSIMNRHYEKALRNINNFLKKNPDYPEALFLKAQILNEGFGYHESARKCLKKIIDMDSVDKQVHYWASSYLGQIYPAEMEKNGIKRNGSPDLTP